MSARPGPAGKNFTRQSVGSEPSGDRRSFRVSDSVPGSAVAVMYLSLPSPVTRLGTATWPQTGFQGQSRLRSPTQLIHRHPLPDVGRTSRHTWRSTLGDATQNPTAGRRRRRYPRYLLDTRIEVRVFRPNKSESFWGRSNEFGEDGLSATLTGELEAGEVVSLDLPLPPLGYRLKLRALVRYRAGLLHGFEFLAKNDEQRDAIRRLCEQLQAKGCST